MNIAEAFLELDKLNETTHQSTGINFPEVILEYEDLEVEFYANDSEVTEEVDIEYSANGLDVAAFFVEDCITEADYPEFFTFEDVNSKEADEWLIAHWDELLEKYHEQLLTHYEEAAREEGADKAYADFIEYDDEMRITHGKGFDYFIDEPR